MRQSSSTRRMRKRDEGLVVDVTAPPQHSGATVEVNELDELVKLAKRYDAVVMRQRSTDGDDQFWVWDQGMLYGCTSGAPAPDFADPGAGPAPTPLTDSDAADQGAPSVRDAAMRERTTPMGVAAPAEDLVEDPHEEPVARPVSPWTAGAQDQHQGRPDVPDQADRPTDPR